MRDRSKPLALPVFVGALTSTFALASVVGCHRHRGGESHATFGRAAPPAPSTRVEPVTDDYGSVKIVDPYRWLEDATSAEVKAWTLAQDQRTRSYLAESALHAPIHARIDALMSVGSIGASALRPNGAGAPRLFYASREGSEPQAVLHLRDGLHGADRVFIDPSKSLFDGDVAEETRSIDWWYPSEDGALVAYGVSRGGDEMSSLRVRQVDSGIDLPDEIPRTLLSSVAWMPSGKSFFYTRYPAVGQVPAGEDHYHRSVYLHRLGDDYHRDALIWPTLDKPRAMTDFPSVDVTPSGHFVVIHASQGSSRSSLFLQAIGVDGVPLPKAPMQTLVDPENKPDGSADAAYDAMPYAIPSSDGGPDRDAVYVRTNEGAPNFKVMVFDPHAPSRDQWTEVVAEQQDPLCDIGAVGSSLFLSYLHRASTRIEQHTLSGALVTTLPLPPFSNAGVPHGSRFLPTTAIYSIESYVEPPQLRALDLTTNNGAAQGGVRGDVLVQVHAAIDARQFDVEQIEATSKDGAIVTAFVVHKKAAIRDGAAPTILYGYGGFSISQLPTFPRSAWTFLEHGGVYVVANLRGGAEYGESWHRAGMLDRKQHVFDDAIAVAEKLIALRITSPSHLAVMGGSNGGLLVLALVTQRPDLFRAAVASVPLADMLRFDRFLVGKLWTPEYGSATNPAQLPALLAYSPYQHVTDGVKYPAVLITTGEGDARVDPLHAKKMTARLQAATASKNPILLRVETKAGHGAGKPRGKQLEEQTDQYTFLFEQLGMRL